MFVNFCTWCKVEVQILFLFFLHAKILEIFEADSELKAFTAKTVPKLCTIHLPHKWPSRGGGGEAHPFPVTNTLSFSLCHCIIHTVSDMRLKSTFLLHKNVINYFKTIRNKAFNQRFRDDSDCELTS